MSDGTSTPADLSSTKVDAHSENFPTHSHEESTGNRSHSPAAPLPLCRRRRIEKMFIRLTSVLMLAMCFTACSGYNNSPAAPTAAPAGSTTVAIASGAFTQTTTAFGQNPLTIAVGTTISWFNNDNTTHTSTADANQWSSGNIPPGAGSTSRSHRRDGSRTTARFTRIWSARSSCNNACRALRVGRAAAHEAT